MIVNALKNYKNKDCNWKSHKLVMMAVEMQQWHMQKLKYNGCCFLLCTDK